MNETETWDSLKSFITEIDKKKTMGGGDVVVLFDKTHKNITRLQFPQSCKQTTKMQIKILEL